MTDDKPKKATLLPRRLFAAAPSVDHYKSHPADFARDFPSIAEAPGTTATRPKRVKARKALAKAEKGASGLAKPRKPKKIVSTYPVAQSADFNQPAVDAKIPPLETTLCDPVVVAALTAKRGKGRPRSPDRPEYEKLGIPKTSYYRKKAKEAAK